MRTAETSSSATGAGLRRTLRAFRHRNYRLFFSGQAISLVGTWMQVVAQSWLVYRLTGSAVLLGVVGFAGQIPVSVLSPLGGAVADRHNRRRILLATQSAAMLLAFALAALSLLERVEVWHVFVLAVLLGISSAFDVPARQAFVIDMVGGGDDILNAVALNSSLFNGARVVGPALAGILLATIGEGWCFFANGLSYIAVIVGLMMMNVAVPARAPLVGSTLQSIVEGFRYVGRTGAIRALLLLIALVSLVGMPYGVLMPIFADKILGGGPSGLGLLMGATGVGAFAGALLLASRQGARGLDRWVALSAGAFGGSLIVFAASRWFWVSAALLLLVGFTAIVQMASTNTLIQIMVPDQLRGRVMAVYSMMFLGVAPFGALLAGAIAQRLGAAVTVAAGGAACLVGALVFWVHLPALRIETRQLVVALQVAGGDPADEATGQRAAVLPPRSSKP